MEKTTNVIAIADSSMRMRSQPVCFWRIHKFYDTSRVEAGWRLISLYNLYDDAKDGLIDVAGKWQLATGKGLIKIKQVVSLKKYCDGGS